MNSKRNFGTLYSNHNVSYGKQGHHQELHCGCISKNYRIEFAASDILWGIGFLTASVRLSTIQFFYAEAQSLWQQDNTCKTIHRFIAIIAGHCHFGRHEERLGIPSCVYCKSCGSEKKDETVFHFMCYCPALARKRNRFLISLISD